MSTISKAVNDTEGIVSLKRPAEQADINDGDAKKSCPEVERVKKRKIALVLAYSGQGYLGLQRLVFCF